MSVTEQPRKVPPLRGAREAQGISIRELARKTGLDATFLSRVERGEERLSLRSVEKVGCALGLRDLVRLVRPWNQ
jgi:transcriptional regulator with XRE-family HTH domain